MVSADGPSGRIDFLLTGSLFDDIGLLRADTMSYVWGAGQTVTEPRVRGVIGGLVGELRRTAGCSAAARASTMGASGSTASASRRLRSTMR